jgi:hypothetical protein
MAEIKRKFYNTGDAKGFTKAVFFDTVVKIANGEDVDGGLVDLVIAAAEYELDGIANKSTAGTGEKKDPLQSDYAVALKNDLIGFIPKNTGDVNAGKTAKELIEMADKNGKLSPKGTSYAAPWVSRVFNNAVEVMVVKKVVTKVDGKGLKSQSEVNAYLLV